MNKILKIIFTGGGSGGHTMPALSMIQDLKEFSNKEKKEIKILFIGSYNGVEKDILKKHNIDYNEISTGKLRRYFSFNNITDIFKVIKGISQANKIIKKFDPDILVSTGGYVSIPPVMAAKKNKIPIIIHEQTINSGLANRIAGKYANKIALTFKESLKYFPKQKCVITGIPLRKEIFRGSKEKAFKRFGLDKTLPVLLFMGGGLGCHILNQTSLNILEDLLENFNIIFQTGRSIENSDHKEILKLKKSLINSKSNKFVVFEFIENEIGDVYSITDLAIARSGAGTVNELMSLKIPAIFIPLQIATNNEQLKNAKIMEKIGSAVIIEENNLTPELLKKNINNIIMKKEIQRMKKNLKNHKMPNGNKIMLDLIISEIAKY